MECMTSSIVSKIRFVARDEQLFSIILCMPVPPQLYFVRWVRLMFGREVAGGIECVMNLWDNFFDLASARSSIEDVPISIALLDVLKVAACGMILLIRPQLLAPTVTSGGMMTGDPDPESGISFLMNYPPLEDVGPLLATMKDLLAKEKKISTEYPHSSKEIIPSNPPLSIRDPPRLNCEENSRSPSQNEAQSAYEERSPSRVHRARRRSPQPSHQIHDVAESIGNIAGELMDFGSKTASAAIANLQKQWHAIEHPLQSETRTVKVNASQPARRGDDFSIAYRPHYASNSLDHEADSEFGFGESKNAESEHARKDEMLGKTVANIVPAFIVEEETDDVIVEKISTFERRPSDANSVASMFSNYSASKCIGEDPMKKNSKKLANILDKSVSKLMNHFQGRPSIPGEIWDAIADIDLVKKELLQQAAISSFQSVRRPSEESTASVSRTG